MGENPVAFFNEGQNAIPVSHLPETPVFYSCITKFEKI